MAAQSEVATVRRLISQASFPLFQGLSDDDLALLLAGERVQEFQPGQTILAQGDYLAEMYVIVSGLVRVTLPDRNNVPRQLAEVGPGAPLGEMSLLTGEPTSATATALTTCRLLVVTQAAFRDAIARSVTLSRNIAAILASRLRMTNRRTVDTDESQFVPIFADKSRWEAAQLVALNLAVSIAWHSGRRVLLANLTAAEYPSVISHLRSELPGLIDLMREPARLREHERPSPIEGPLMGVRVIEDRLDDDPSLAGAADSQLKLLAPLYDYVVAVLPSDTPLPLTVTLRQAQHVFALGGRQPDTQRDRFLAEAAREVSGGAEAIRLLDTEAPVARLGGRWAAPVLPLPGEHEAIALPGIARNGTGAEVFVHRATPHPAARAIGFLARDVADLKVGFALGGGSNKGYAHVSALETMERHGIPIDYIAGCSIGAIVGALRALGYGYPEIERMLTDAGKHIFRPTLPFRGFLDTGSLTRHIREVGAGRRFEDTQIPLAIVAVDLYARRAVEFRRGPLYRAIMASISIPGVFPPVKVGDRYYVDGGILNPVPTSTAAALGADIVIGIKLARPPDVSDGVAITPRRGGPTILETLLRSSEIMQGKITDEAAARSTIIVEPRWPVGLSLGLRDFGRGREVLPYGKEAAEETIPRLRTVLPWLDRTVPA